MRICVHLPEVNHEHSRCSWEPRRRDNISLDTVPVNTHRTDKSTQKCVLSTVCFTHRDFEKDSVLWHSISHRLIRHNNSGFLAVGEAWLEKCWGLKLQVVLSWSGKGLSRGRSRKWSHLSASQWLQATQNGTFHLCHVLLSSAFCSFPLPLRPWLVRWLLVVNRADGSTRGLWAVSRDRKFFLLAPEYVPPTQTHKQSQARGSSWQPRPVLELSSGQEAQPSLQFMNSFLRSLGHRSLELEEMLELF